MGSVERDCAKSYEKGVLVEYGCNYMYHEMNLNRYQYQLVVLESKSPRPARPSPAPLSKQRSTPSLPHPLARHTHYSSSYDDQALHFLSAQRH